MEIIIKTIWKMFKRKVNLESESVRWRLLLFLIVTSSVVFSRDVFAECNEVNVETFHKGIKIYCIDTEKASEGIQDAIDYAANAGGGIVYLDNGIYKLEKPIYLKSSVSLLGKPNLSKIIVESEIAITQKNEDIIDSIVIKDLIFINGNKDKTKSVFYISGGLQNSRFESLRFLGFDDQTIFYIAPDFKGKPPRNVIFNKFKDIIVDACGKCIVYSAKPYSVVSENTWENVILKKVNQKAIEAVNWVDTEKWYNLYARAMRSNVILIDINAYNLEHAHGFHFYSPTLVYDRSLKNSPKKPSAIRVGKGTIRNVFIGVATDKKWDSFLIDDSADSYYILMDTVEDKSVAREMGKKSLIKIIKKGVSEQ